MHICSLTMSTMIEIPESMLVHLKCNACSEYLSVSPITLSGSHKICGRCTSDRGSKIIDQVYEGFAMYFLFPCRYRNTGCVEKHSLSDMAHHESICAHKEKPCPERENNCGWVGKYTSLLTHYEEQHTDSIVQHPFAFRPDVSKDNNTSLIMKMGELLLLVNIQFSKENGIFKYEFYFIGDSKPAETFMFYWILTGTNGTFLKSGQIPFEAPSMETTIDLTNTRHYQDNLIFKLR